MKRRAFLALPLPLLAAGAPADVVLLVEDSPAFAPVVASLVAPPFEKSDRVAVMAYHQKPRVLARFTNDRKIAEKSVRRISPRFQFGAGKGVQHRELKLNAAIAAAAKLLEESTAPRRAIIVVFGTDSSDEIQEMPASVRVVAVAAQPYVVEAFSPAATPPTAPGRKPPQQSRLPDATIQKLRDRKVTVIEGRPDLVKAFELALA